MHGRTVLRMLLRLAVRFGNGLAKIANGLTPFGESVWPGVRNDLFVAHSSIYDFFAKNAKGKRVLDAGCGAGYGAYHLAVNGASSVFGVDVDKRSIRFARRKYFANNLEFAVADLENLILPENEFDLVVSSNVLEHLDDPGEFFKAVRNGLTKDGTLILALPPIVSEEDLEVHDDIHYHRSNLSVDAWLELFESEGWDVQMLAHRCSESETALDFSSPFRSRVGVSDFSFTPSDRDEMYREPPITAIYVLVIQEL
ncbi:MAG: class I SAM-dependent methyltransferase [bacterium]|nr:class I SAM-dependent methyltransferase [bacterium]